MIIYLSLKALALRLAKDGPVKVEWTPKRIRILLGGAYIADTAGTSGALLVWEHPYYPQLYLPDAAFKEPEGFGTVYSERDIVKNEQGKGVATIKEVSVRSHDFSKDDGDNDLDETQFTSCWEIIHFAPDLDGDALSIRDMWKVKFDAVGMVTSRTLVSTRALTDGLTQTAGSRKIPQSSCIPKIPTNASTQFLRHVPSGSQFTVEPWL